uniref:Late secretory pathway protein AVL9 homolog (inferred by orthology to a human protein) n=1 Tax=Strongyloides venezuelensis TaxID=75913 RepID=A0A0K0FWA1_STRVS
MTNAVLHVIVVGFHHKKGCQIEYCYPPINSSCSPKEEDIPKEWVNLPSLALPDGAHNVDKDVVYFLLPSLDEHNRSVFGISCYRQIAADELVAKEKDVTRSTVQKSVCIISRIPLYGSLLSKLEIITEAYFNEKDFSKVDVLKQMYKNLSDMFHMDIKNDETLIEAADIPLNCMLNTFKGRVLMLFKLILLEKKVMFNIFPTHKLGNSLFGLISLFPSLTQYGLFEAAHYSVLQRKSNLVESVSEEEKSKISSCNTMVVDDFGFPLSLFVKGYLFHPYLSICYMDMIKSDNVRAFCIGTTNTLFNHRRELFDIMITLNEDDDLVIDYLESDLKKKLHLTTADLRFADYIAKQSSYQGSEISWEGSDDWIRFQFRAYLLSLLSTSISEDKDLLDDFNTDFINEWKCTLNYRIWLSKTHLGFDGVVPGHPFARQLNIGDLKLKMSQHITDSEGGRRIVNNIATTSKYVSDAGSKMKSSISSWFKGG